MGQRFLGRPIQERRNERGNEGSNEKHATVKQRSSGVGTSSEFRGIHVTTPWVTL